MVYNCQDCAVQWKEDRDDTPHRCWVCGKFASNGKYRQDGYKYPFHAAKGMLLSELLGSFEYEGSSRIVRNARGRNRQPEVSGMFGYGAQ